MLILKETKKVSLAALKNAFYATTCSISGFIGWLWCIFSASKMDGPLHTHHKLLQNIFCVCPVCPPVQSLSSYWCSKLWHKENSGCSFMHIGSKLKGCCWQQSIPIVLVNVQRSFVSSSTMSKSSISLKHLWAIFSPFVVKLGHVFMEAILPIVYKTSSSEAGPNELLM